MKKMSKSLINLFSVDWLMFLELSINNLYSIKPIAYSSITPSQIPEQAGVYLISEIIDNIETALYVGRSKNLRNRLYRNHLMGNPINARLKKYMMQDEFHPAFENKELAKQYIKEKCFVRWILEDNIRKRGALEGYFTAIFFPKYGISEEH
jgi:hypothetical protein